MKHVCLFLIVAMMIGILPAVLAAPVLVDARNLPTQDDLIFNGWFHEIGDEFPLDELILVEEVPWEGHIPCPENPEGNLVQIRITNLSPYDWTDLVYVADPETTLGNMDGEVEDQTPFPRIPSPSPGYTLAFKIDNQDINTPLVSESITPNNIFEVGEVWEFVIQDYNNSLGLSPAQIDSWDSGSGMGQVAFASAGGPPSSGSIIGVIPEPSVIVMALAAGGGLLFIRRKFMI